MDIIVGVWGLGANIGTSDRVFDWIGHNLGIPPMSSIYPGNLELGK